MPTINGQRGAFLRVVGIGQDQSGQYTRVRAEGSTNEIQQLIPQLRQSFATYEITRGYTGVADVIEARIPVPIISTTQPEIPVDNWETFAEEVEKNILQADLAAVEALSIDDKSILKAALEGGLQRHEIVELSAIFDSDYGKRLFAQVISGVESIRILVPHLRHTQTVSQLWTVKAALTHVGRILSTVTMFQIESVPATVLFDLPTNASQRTDMQYGWYKKYPTVRFAAGQRIQIEQEWEYGLWSTLLYGDPINEVAPG